MLLHMTGVFKTGTKPTYWCITSVRDRFITLSVTCYPDNPRSAFPTNYLWSLKEKSKELGHCDICVKLPGQLNSI